MAALILLSFYFTCNLFVSAFDTDQIISILLGNSSHADNIIDSHVTYVPSCEMQGETEHIEDLKEHECKFECLYRFGTGKNYREIYEGRFVHT